MFTVIPLQDHLLDYSVWRETDRILGSFLIDLLRTLEVKLPVLIKGSHSRAESGLLSVYRAHTILIKLYIPPLFQ